ncbi:MAG: class I SAM-dependent methyltransferase [Oscillospiraceae bacterium]|nr:class I SAM-dependent methyltransferase [Oscillospiraceae bacterium]
MNEEKFTGKAGYYAKYRPSYPAVVVDRLYNLTHAEAVADIGAGTGKFTEKLLTKPWQVTAVEPNLDMCRELMRTVAGKAEICTGTAENTGLPSHSFGLITTAQAFHWFDENKFREECKRLLTPDGRLAIVFNSRYQGDIMPEREGICRKYCPLFGARGHVGIRSEEEGDSFLRNEYFTSVEVFKIENPVMMTREHFIGDALSRSYSPREGDENFQPFVKELLELFDKWHRYGKISVSYTTTCYAGKF